MHFGVPGSTNAPVFEQAMCCLVAFPQRSAWEPAGPCSLRLQMAEIALSCSLFGLAICTAYTRPTNSSHRVGASVRACQRCMCPVVGRRLAGFDGGEGCSQWRLEECTKPDIQHKVFWFSFALSFATSSRLWWCKIQMSLDCVASRLRCYRQLARTTQPNYTAHPPPVSYPATCELGPPPLLPSSVTSWVLHRGSRVGTSFFKHGSASKEITNEMSSLSSGTTTVCLQKLYAVRVDVAVLPPHRLCHKQCNKLQRNETGPRQAVTVSCHR
jgi:hypothetical protein